MFVLGSGIPYVCVRKWYTLCLCLEVVYLMCVLGRGIPYVCIRKRYNLCLCQEVV